MALENESPKEFWFGVLEDLSQDIGFRSIICVIYQVSLQFFLYIIKDTLKNTARLAILVHYAQLWTV